MPIRPRRFAIALISALMACTDDGPAHTTHPVNLSDAGQPPEVDANNTDVQDIFDDAAPDIAWDVPLDIVLEPPDVGDEEEGACLPRWSMCGGRCVNLAVDVRRCGACEVACEEGEVCSAGRCVAPCGAGWGLRFAPEEIALPGPVAALATGDLDGDGSDEVIGAAADRDEVWIVERGGAVEAVPINGRAAAVAAGDIDGDGDLDVVVAVASAGRLAVLVQEQGEGGGERWRLAAGRSTGGAPTDLALADFNRDGVLDALVANGGAGGVAWLQGLGDGTFRPPTFALGGSGPGRIAVGNLNTDAFPDAALVRDSDQAAYTLINRITRFDTARLDQDPVHDAAFIRTDADPWDDLVLVGEGVIVRRGAANGLLGPPRRDAASSPLLRALPADLDGDGDANLAASLREQGSAALLRLGAGGRFMPWRWLPLPSAQPPLLAVGDLDGEGVTDLVAATGAPPDRLALYPSAAAAPSAQAWRLDAPSDLGVVAGDLDGDGAEEAFVSAGATLLRITAGDLAASHKLPAPARLLALVEGAKGQRGALLLATAEELWIGDAPPGEAMFHVKHRLPLHAPLLRAALDDLRGAGGGEQELVTLHADGALMAWGEVGQGAAPGPPRLIATLPRAQAMALAQLDRDAPAELVLPDPARGALVILSARDGRVERTVSMREPIDVRAADLDRDGLDDLVVVVAEEEGGRLALLQRTDAGGFLRRDVRTPAAVEAPVVLDLDRDGWPDLVARERDGAALVVIRARPREGRPTWGEVERVVVSSGLDAFAFTRAPQALIAVGASTELLGVIPGMCLE